MPLGLGRTGKIWKRKGKPPLKKRKATTVTGDGTDADENDENIGENILQSQSVPSPKQHCTSLSVSKLKQSTTNKVINTPVTVPYFGL